MFTLDFGDDVKHSLVGAMWDRERLEPSFVGPPPDFDIQRFRHRCMPHRFTVRASMARNITDSTARPIKITVSRPANTVAVSRSFRASKMYQPMPPERADTPKTSSAATSVRHAKAQPIFRPAIIDGNAAGIRMRPT